MLATRGLASFPGNSAGLFSLWNCGWPTPCFRGDNVKSCRCLCSITTRVHHSMHSCIVTYALCTCTRGSVPPRLDGYPLLLCLHSRLGVPGQVYSKSQGATAPPKDNLPSHVYIGVLLGKIMHHRTCAPTLPNTQREVYRSTIEYTRGHHY